MCDCAGEEPEYEAGYAVHAFPLLSPYHAIQYGLKEIYMYMYMYM